MKVDFETFIEVGEIFQALRDNAVDRAKYDASMGMRTEQIIAEAIRAAKSRGYDLAIERLREGDNPDYGSAEGYADWLAAHRPDDCKRI